MGKPLNSILLFVTQIDLSDAQIALTLQPKKLIEKPELQNALLNETVIESRLSLQKRGQEMRLLLGDCDADTTPDNAMVKMWPAPFERSRVEIVKWLYQRRRGMSGKRYSPEEIISKLREAEVYLAEGVTVGEVIRWLGVNKITYYRWRKEYGGMRVEQAKRLKDLEKENARLKRLLADAELDKAILREAAEGNF